MHATIGLRATLRIAQARPDRRGGICLPKPLLSPALPYPRSGSNDPATHPPARVAAMNATGSQEVHLRLAHQPTVICARTPAEGPPTSRRRPAMGFRASIRRTTIVRAITDPVLPPRRQRSTSSRATRFTLAAKYTRSSGHQAFERNRRDEQIHLGAVPASQHRGYSLSRRRVTYPYIPLIESGVFQQPRLGRV